jgi:hypothetical protein
MSPGRERIDSRRVAGVVLRAAIVPFVASALIVGVGALRDDLKLAFRYAGASVFPPSLARQLPTVLERIPEGRPILLLAPTANAWNARLWQRALYPRNPVIVRYEPFPDRAALARMAGVRDALFLGRPPRSLSVEWSEPIGSDSDGSERVVLGRPLP